MDRCITVLVRLFFNWSMNIYSKYQIFIFSTFYILVSICHKILNAVICSLITLFFKCIKLHQVLCQFSTIDLAQALGINIFGKDYSNLNNPIHSKDINLHCTRFIVENKDNIWCNQKEVLFWHYIFLKKTYLAFF